jgi:hypothetical protein
MARRRATGTEPEFIKWAEVPEGHTCHGIWAGSREGKFGLIGDLVQTDGSALTFSLTYSLVDQLLPQEKYGRHYPGVPEGSEAWITLVKKWTDEKTNRPRYKFAVDWDDPAEPAGPEGEADTVVELFDGQDIDLSDPRQG